MTENVGDSGVTKNSGDRRLRVRYAALTVALFAPLLWAFVSVRNLYPVAASTMMMAGGGLEASEYFVLRGETLEGDTVDIPAIELSDALTGRIFGLVSATIENKSFTIRWPHPSNTALAASTGGVEQLPRAARIEELLRAWGEIYNSRLPRSSARRLKAVRLDAYLWDGRSYGDYARFVESWKAEL